MSSQPAMLKSDPQFPYADGDLLRKSFARIVNRSSPTPQPMGLSQPSFGVNYAASLPTSSGYASSMYNQNMYESSQSEMGYQIHARDYDARRYNSPKQNSLSDISRKPSYDDYQKSILQSYPVMSQPLCATCAACQTCGPARLNQLNSQSQNGEFEFLQEQKREQKRERQNEEKRLESDRKFQQDLESQYEMENQMIKEMQEKQIRRQRSQLASESFTSDIGNNEYEKWKTRHGLKMGRSMKKGLTKLQNATNASNTLN